MTAKSAWRICHPFDESFARPFSLGCKDQTPERLSGIVEGMSLSLFLESCKVYADTKPRRLRRTLRAVAEPVTNMLCCVDYDSIVAVSVSERIADDDSIKQIVPKAPAD